MLKTKKTPQISRLSKALFCALLLAQGNAFAVDLVGYHDNSPGLDLLARSSIDLRASSSFADDFASKSLDRSRYSKAEVIREIDNAKGMLRSYSGAVNSGAGVNFTRTNNWIVGSESHTSVEADIVITEVKHGSANHPAFANIGGTFYSNSSTNDGQLGHVFVQVKLGYRGNGLESWVSIGTSKDSGFNTADELPPITIISPGEIAEGDTLHAKLTYNGGSSFGINFTVTQASGGVSSSSTSFQGPTKKASASGRKRIGTGIDWDDSANSVDPSSVSVDALFDNVSTGGFKVLTFDSPPINKSELLETEEYRAVQLLSDNPALRLEAFSSDSSQNADRSVDLQLKDPSDYLEADIMLASASNLPQGTRSRVRVQGHWYNDSNPSPTDNVGEVYAHVAIERSSDGNLFANAYVSRSTDANFTGAGEKQLLSEVFSASVEFDQFYKAIITRTSDSLKLSFAGEEKIFPISTDAFAPFDPLKKIKARLQGGVGNTIAFVDNVRSDASVAFAPQPTTPTPEQPSTPDTEEESDSGGGGGGAFASFGLLVLLGALRLRRRRRA
jgi:MYXO-CTERM domain-containing protein